MAKNERSAGQAGGGVRRERAVAAAVSAARFIIAPFPLDRLAAGNLVDVLSFGRMSLAGGLRLAAAVLGDCSATEAREAFVWLSDASLAGRGSSSAPAALDGIGEWAIMLCDCARAWRRVLLDDGVAINFAGSPVGMVPEDAGREWFADAGRAIGVEPYVEAVCSGVPMEDLFA